MQSVTPALWTMRVKISRAKDYWQLQRFQPCACPNCDDRGHWIVLRGSSSVFDRDEMKKEMERNQTTASSLHSAGGNVIAERAT